MRIPDDALNDFIAIYKEEVGEEISRVDAREMASQLITLYGLLSKKLPGEHNVTPNGEGEA